MLFTSSDDALSALAAMRSPSPSLTSPQRTETLEKMREYLKILDLDLTPLKIIHVAGTKGKGSTCAMTESICQALGYRTGLYTSPHVINVRERFRVNGKPIEEELFLRHFNRIWNRFTEVGVKIPGFFRFFTLMGFQIFLELKVDVLVLEVGMGGRLDPTNVIDHPVVCGITTLDLDHIHILGDTIEEIAGEKAGIFKPHVPAFTIPQEASAMSELMRVAELRGTPLVSLMDARIPLCCSMGLAGSHQRMNGALALALAWTFHQIQQKNQQSSSMASSAADAAAGTAVCASATTATTMTTSGDWWRDSLPLEVSMDIESQIEYIVMSNPLVQHGLANSQWPGRCQTVHAMDVNWYLDGAHTFKSMRHGVEWFRQISLPSSNDTSMTVPMTTTTTPKKKIRGLIFYCSYDRDIAYIVQPLLSIPFDHIVFCPLDSPSCRPPDISMPTLDEMLNDSFFSSPAGPQFVSPEINVLTPKFAWQHQLLQLWTILLQNRDGSGNGNASRLPHMMVLPSVAEAMAHFKTLKDLTCSVVKVEEEEYLNADHVAASSDDSWSTDSPEVDVMVTGSLYLVGEMLRCLNWSHENEMQQQSQ